MLRRFRSERQIPARLDHPNIARLLDAGTTEDGLPYFVMEYVAGARITDYCFANGLSVGERINLFPKVCPAVQFAHQKLIVHRDLKPANILVTGDGEPKLLDFGIAKLLDDGGVDVTSADRQRSTPAYASPEKVRGEPITTVSAVYAMGALLYELLSGVTPHRFANPNPSPTELLRVVGDQRPARPSSATPDASRKSKLRDDVDRIVLKALRKEPGERYPGINSFARLRRYLEGKPIRARQATFRYRKIHPPEQGWGACRRARGAGSVWRNGRNCLECAAGAIRSATGAGTLRRCAQAPDRHGLDLLRR